MNYIKNNNFLKMITPTIDILTKEFIDHDMNYVCTYCSMNCSRHDRHDKNCILLIANNISNEFKQIELDASLTKNFRGESRLEEEIYNIRNSLKVTKIMNELSPYIQHFIPLDFSDPANQQIVCTCNFAGDSSVHTEDCPEIAISKSLSYLFSVK